MAARRTIAYCILAVGAALVPLGLLLVVDGWTTHIAANPMGTATTAVTVLALSLALGSETSIPIRSLDILLSSLLLCAIAILPGLQQGFKLEVVAPIIVGGTLILWVAWVLLLGISQAKRINQMVLVVAVLLLMDTIASWLDEHGHDLSLTGGFVLMVAGAVAGGLLVPYFRAGFEQLVDVEERRVVPGPLPPDLQVQASLGARKTCGLGVAGLASVLWLTVSVAPSLNFTRGVGRSSIDLTILSSAAFCLALLLVSSMVPRRAVARQNILCYFAGTIWLIGATYALINDFNFRPLLFFPLILVALWTWISLISGTVVLQSRSLPRTALLLPSVCTAAAFVSFYWALTTGLHPEGTTTTYPWSLLAIALTCTVNFALVLSSGAVLAKVSADRCGSLVGSLYGPVRSLTQDELLLTAQVVILIWFPALVLEHIPPSTSERWAAVASMLGGLILFLSPLFFWVLRLHTRHAVFERHLRLGTRELHRPYPLLMKPIGQSLVAILRQCGPASSSPITHDSEWCQVQRGNVNIRNLIAMMLVSFSVVGILGYIINMRDPTRITQRRDCNSKDRLDDRDQ